MLVKVLHILVGTSLPLKKVVNDIKFGHFCTQMSDDDATTSEGRRSLFKQLIAESDQASQLVSLSILLSAWPQLAVDSDR